MALSLAALALLASGAARLWTDCPFPCLPREEAPASWSAQVSGLTFDQEAAGVELMVTRAFGARWGAFQPVAGLSVASGGEVWAGGGVRWTFGTGRLRVEASFLPGLQLGGGHDLGHPVEFRSGVALAWTLDGGGSLALTLDHRSNAGLGARNPGAETIGLRASWPLD